MTTASAGLEAHVWFVDLDVEPKPHHSETLSQGECDRAAGFVFGRDRKRFVAARTALRSILSTWVDIPAGELEFVYGSRWKPSLALWCRVGDLRFNLSHSQGCALVALAHGQEIGVDIEQVRHLDDVDAIVSQEFSNGEREVFDSLPTHARGDAFFRAWVQKEAYLKATGEGLYHSLADIEVAFAPHQRARVLAVSGDTSASKLWSTVSLVPCSGYFGAIVAEAPAINLTLHRYQEPQRRGHRE